MLHDFEEDINGNPINFDGNINLKKINCKLAYTKEHIEEFDKCRNDWRYLAENYIYVLNLDEGMVKPILRDYQIEMISSYIENRYNITLASRQVGKTLSVSIFILWTILFQNDKQIAILANKNATSVEILTNIKSAYELLPKWLQQGVKKWNANSIKLENGSKVFASSTSSTGIRGRAVNLLFIDECIAGDSIITVKNKNTNEIIKISIEEFYKRLEHKNDQR